MSTPAVVAPKPPAYPGSQRFLRVRRFNSIKSDAATELPHAYSIRTEDTSGDHGSLTFYIPKIKHDGTATNWASVGIDDIIIPQAWNWVTLAWEDHIPYRVVELPDVTIPQGGGIPGIKVVCRGATIDFETAVVRPYGGAGRVPWGDMRHFGWQAPELPDTPGTGWVSPNVRSNQGNTSSGGYPPYGLAGKPHTWPNPLSQYLWGQPPISGQDPVGRNYFRYSFTTYAALDITMYVIADDLFVAALDGVEVIEFNRAPDNSAGWTHFRRFSLPAGNHTIAFLVENIPRPGSTDNCGLLNVALMYDIPRALTTPWNTADTRRYLLTTSTAPEPAVGSGSVYGWRSLAYPATAPGMTVGRILYHLTTEAQAKNELQGWTFVWGTDLDAAGVPWGEIVPNYQTRVGRTIWEVLKELQDQGWCTAVAQQGSLTLNIYRSAYTYPTIATPLAAGVNITGLTHTPRRANRTDKLLARTEDGWVERGTGATSGTVSIADISDPTAFNAYIDMLIARSQLSTDLAAVEIAPIHIDHRAYGGLFINRRIVIPGRTGGTRTESITKHIVEEQTVGPPTQKIELISVRTQAEQQLAFIQDRNAPGALKGNASAIAPYTKSQPQSSELRLTEISFNLPDIAEDADSSAAAQGLAYADSADYRAPFRMRVMRAKLTARTPQSGETAPTGTTAVQVRYNGVGGICLSLTGANYEVDDAFGSTAIFAPQITANWYLEIGPEDAINVWLVTAGKHRGLRLVLSGFQVP